MNLGEYSVKNKVNSWLLVLLMTIGGVLAYFEMGKLEDPAFTIKEAKIITSYPGASPQEVYDEVTYHIEDAVRLLGQVKRIKRSVTREGLSDITIEFKDEYSSAEMPGIYDELRRKIADNKHKLPPGAGEPQIVDDFADVYGGFLALNGEGYTYRELKDVADNLKKQLVLVPGVRKVSIDGDQKEVVYVQMSRSKMAELGIDMATIENLLSSQNLVSDSGRFRVGPEYIRIEPTGSFKHVSEIEDLLISSNDKKLIRLGDVAQVTREYVDEPTKLIYFNGKPSLTIGISMLSGKNVVEVGGLIADKIDSLQNQIPLGMNLDIIYDQPTEVDQSVAGFVTNTVEALIIVVVVLLAFMGLRVGLIIGAVLLITVAGTLALMHLYGIELQRISLGALIIALGMLVDNAIVVAEGMMIRIKRGVPALKAAGEVVGANGWALLGGTAVGILAFAAIGMSQSNTGEFTRSLFYVILISLSLSWVTAVSTTPLLCALLLKKEEKKEGEEEKDPYAGAGFVIYKSVLTFALKQRLLTIGVIVAMFLASVWGFGFVKNAFFPNANTPMFFVDIWEVEGTDIRQTRDDTLKVAEFIRQQEGVEWTASFIGGGASRFSLVYTPQDSTKAYGQIIVRTETRELIAGLQQKIDTYMTENIDSIEPKIKSLRIGPGRDSKIEARFAGPDPEVLRDLSAQAEAIMHADPEAKEVRNDWRQPVKLIKPIFNEQVARQLGVTRTELTASLRAASEGSQVGIYRDGVRLLPIYFRADASERQDVSQLMDAQVYSPVLQRTVPIAQVVLGFETVWEDAMIRGRDRLTTIIASANPTGELAAPLFERLKPQIEAIELPPGYTMDWGGEYEDSAEAQGALFSAIPVSFIMMIIVVVLLFGKVRQPLIIWITVPLAIIGITAGLLLLNGAFDFMALLGALSLIGLLIKNAIVLLEEIDMQAEEKPLYDAIIDSSISRMRPVMLAACTTILGMIPLLGDVFFVNMSITVMFGLGFATILTLVFIPVMYAILFKAKNPQ
ncbi:efflux RND transporter permease subunit [Vibrio hangzhouensis]|uniref:efflux RND transporter permease subunit n=1 Tax=Vibrio hangzhouensis TaxID=462991 RepID=UPI001C9719FA|nr:efflux RND transporter permease subunit [Vibrio hangzhouensis]MBY6198338.1 efflux RND transporter permease subunit [Vibrio hangzhouensis]